MSLKNTELELSRTIAKNIKEQRIKKGMTQTEVANYLNVSKSIISAYEKGIRSPSLEALYRLSRVFNVHVSELLMSDEMKSITESIETTYLTPHQKCIVEEMVKGFLKENYLKNKNEGND